MEMTSTLQISNYLLGGNCTFTLYSKKLDKRYTYRVKKQLSKDDEPIFFCQVLYGPDNEKDYRFIGWIYEEDFTLRTSRKGACDITDTRFTMFKYFLQMLCTEEMLPEACEFIPSGRCARCGRKLTVPISVYNGFGPECRRHV